MHGLTGGSWKRSGYRAMATEKNNPTGNRRATSGSVTYYRPTSPRQLSTLLRYGNSALLLGQIRNYALTRLALWLSKRGNRRRAWGWGMTQVLLSPNHLGLISLDGIVVPPRPFRAWKVECRR
jgi:hypothetical protein